MFFLRLLIAGLVAFSLSSACLGQVDGAWPGKPIHFVVGFTPGGPSDVMARSVGRQMGELLKQTVIVENRPGAGGNLAAEFVAKSPADGTTWLLGNNSILATNALLYSKLPFDPLRDFEAVGLIGFQPSILVVNASLPVKNVAQLITYAKANPGKTNFASSGTGAAPHLAGQLFKTQANLDIEHVPYKGAQPALTDLIGGQVQMMFATSASAMPFVQQNRLRALAVTSTQRMLDLPDIPTMMESGLPQFEAVSWHGIVVAAGTPSAIIQRLNLALNQALNNKEILVQFKNLGMQVVPGSAATFTGLIKSEMPKWAKMVKDSGAKSD